MKATLFPSYHTNTNLETSSLHLSSLLDLGKQQIAIIDEVIANDRFGDIDSTISQRLKDLGFLPNTTIRVIAKSLFGKPPYVVQLGTGAQFSLRTDELMKIRCHPLTT